MERFSVWMARSAGLPIAVVDPHRDANALDRRVVNGAVVAEATVAR